MREDVIRVVETYLNGLAAKDLSRVPFHADVSWHGPEGHWIRGERILRAVLSSFTMIKGIRIVRHIVDGDWCATMFEMETPGGAIQALDCFHVVDGCITSIRVFLDEWSNVDRMRKA